MVAAVCREYRRFHCRAEETLIGAVKEINLGQGLAKDYSNGATNGVPYNFLWDLEIEYGRRAARSSRGCAMGGYMR